MSSSSKLGCSIKGFWPILSIEHLNALFVFHISGIVWTRTWDRKGWKWLNDEVQAEAQVPGAFHTSAAEPHLVEWPRNTAEQCAAPHLPQREIHNFSNFQISTQNLSPRLVVRCCAIYLHLYPVSHWDHKKHPKSYDSEGNRYDWGLSIFDLRALLVIPTGRRAADWAQVMAGGATAELQRSPQGQAGTFQLLEYHILGEEGG